ncbi:unnamed protein product, partial [Amoebophrya sp. A25]|eukprot:GSA25T00001567001.1
MLEQDEAVAPTRKERRGPKTMIGENKDYGDSKALRGSKSSVQKRDDEDAREPVTASSSLSRADHVLLEPLQDLASSKESRVEACAPPFDSKKNEDKDKSPRGTGNVVSPSAEADNVLDKDADPIERTHKGKVLPRTEVIRESVIRETQLKCGEKACAAQIVAAELQPTAGQISTEGAPGEAASISKKNQNQGASNIEKTREQRLRDKRVVSAKRRGIVSLPTVECLHPMSEPAAGVGEDVVDTKEEEAQQDAEEATAEGSATQSSMKPAEPGVVNAADCADSEERSQESGAKVNGKTGEDGGKREHGSDAPAAVDAPRQDDPTDADEA